MTLTTATLLLLAAAPYVRAHVSSEPGAHCLTWASKDLTWVQNSAGNAGTGGATFSAVSAAFHTWNQAVGTCSDLTFTEGARSNSRFVGMQPNLPNTNLVLFRYSSCSRKAPATAGCWQDGSCGNVYDCWEHATGLLGITTVSYVTATGQILDADIELDAADNTFSTVETPVCTTTLAATCVATDIQNTVTHEVGHLLGLAHTTALRSTMNATSMTGDLSKRVVDPGTASFLCEAYPAGQLAQDCVPGPDGGLGLAGPRPAGCSAAPGGLGALLAWVLVGGRRRRGARLAPLLAAAFTLATPALATTLLALDLDTLTRSSDLVVRATVKQVRARWTADHARIVTDVELEVSEAWKGLPGRRVTLTQPGGVVGPVGQRVEGTATFRPGEEVVAFLEARGAAYTVTALVQGKFTVEGGAVQEAVARQEPSEARFLDPLTRQEVDWAPLALPLPALRARVQALDR